MPDKVYVSVLAICNQDGTTKPLGVIWPDGRKFGVDSVLHIRKAASHRAGGKGVQYTCEICGKAVYLYDEEGRWFMEGK